jgi:hypothetical protein
VVGSFAMDESELQRVRDARDIENANRVDAGVLPLCAHFDWETEEFCPETATWVRPGPEGEGFCKEHS